MKSYDYSATPRILGDCTDMMMRGPVSVTRETPTVTAQGECGCGTADQYSDSPLAIVSSPYQGFGDIFECPREALGHGTLFKNLFLPIKDANGAKSRGGCI
ncbi:MAG: spore coat associated protein CotJA [Clostridia bacterium]|nr:spore coat associated protein CotJA [Clostridia bacterium]